MGIVAFLLFVFAFIARAVSSGMEAEDWVLWMLADLAAMTVAPLIAFVQTRRQP